MLASGKDVRPRRENREKVCVRKERPNSGFSPLNRSKMQSYHIAMSKLKMHKKRNSGKMSSITCKSTCLLRMFNHTVLGRNENTVRTIQDADW